MATRRATLLPLLVRRAFLFFLLCFVFSSPSSLSSLFSLLSLDLDHDLDLDLDPHLDRFLFLFHFFLSLSLSLPCLPFLSSLCSSFFASLALGLRCASLWDLRFLGGSCRFKRGSEKRGLEKRGLEKYAWEGGNHLLGLKQQGGWSRTTVSGDQSQW